MLKRILRIVFGLGLLLGGIPASTTMVQAQAGCANPVACENLQQGTPQSTWDISGSGDTSIQGFATDISYNKGGTVTFKISTPANGYSITIYRMGYYGGNGARQIAQVTPSASLPQTQPACKTDTTTGLVDCGNWSPSASWTIPSTAVSGIYFAKLVRTDTGGSSHIHFVVRDDASHSPLFFQTSDSTWQAYNQYGGNSLYMGNGPGGGSQGGRAYKVSYNRPFSTRSQTGTYGTTNFVWYGEYPMLRWLEMNGYDVSYTSDVDTDRLGSLITNHKVFMSVGHDEYWSGNQRANVEAARAAGVNLAFFSGNEVYWKTRLEPSIDGSATPNRTLVTYKESLNDAPLDPQDPPTWTGLWRDPRFSPPADGGRPENGLTGTIFTVNSGSSAIVVPSAYAKLRLWRNTAIANLTSGSVTLGTQTLGYEWDSDLDNAAVPFEGPAARPAGLIDMSSTTVSGVQVLTDYGSTTNTGTATHHLTLYKAPSGALVFGAGTVQWAWGLDVHHDTYADQGPNTPDPNMTQATINVLADMGVAPTTLQSGMVYTGASTDTTPPTSTITSPANGGSVNVGSVTITGTASDAGGGVVGGVEVSTDGGATWHPATGTNSWSYTWNAVFGGPTTIKSRAADDSGNIETPGAGSTITVNGDKTAPTISAVTPTNMNANSVTITWATNEASSSQVNYGTTTSYGTSTQLDTNLVTSHSVVLGGLTNGTLYHYQVKSADWAGNVATSGDFTFIAGVVPLLGDTAIETGQDNNGAGSAEAFAYTATTSGTANQLQVYLDGANAATSVVVGLYASSSSALNPGALITQATISSPKAGAWNSVTIPATNIVAGTRYWIAILSPLGTGTVYFRDASSGTSQSSSQSNLATLPGTWSPGTGYPSWPLSAYAAQSITTNDTTPPTVSLTAPANNATISGTVTVSAIANDNVSVASVQFLLDNVNLGSPDTASPYSISWNTTGVANGSHTLSATAKDPSGNSATATPISITVSNPPTISGVQATNITATGATINWTTNIPANSQVFYGTTTSYGSSTTLDNTPATNHSQTLSGLIGGTTYHYQVQSTDSTNNTVTSPDQTFATLSATAITNVAANASNSSATVTWTTNNPASSQVFYGTTSSYGSNTTLDSTQITSHSQTLSGLTASTTYHYQVQSKDGTGALVSSPDAQFTTTAAPTCPCSIWPSTATPGTADANDGGAVELGVKFTSDSSGYVTGIRFYKGSLNTGTHVGNLWSSTGTLLATATFSGETASGWQQVNFSSPVQVTANTIYVASYHTNVGQYAVDEPFFAASGVDNPPLHAPSNTTPGGNGVYVYNGSSAFPNQTFNSSNYWVDVVFNTTAPADFQITASPSSQTVTPGGSTTYSVNLATANNYNSSVSLSATGQPSGVTPTFSPTSVTPTSAGATSTLSVATTTATAAGTYTLSVTGTGSDGTKHSATVTLVVTGPDFTISAVPSSLSVTRGTSGSYTVTLTSLNGYASSVNLSVTGKPSAATATFTPTAVTPTATGATSTLTISVPATASRQTKTLTITGKGANGTTHSTTVTLVIR